MKQDNILNEIIPENNFNNRMNILEIRGLEKKYGSQVVLNDIWLKVEAGTVGALLGPNGSGKTTLIKSILDLVHAKCDYIKSVGRERFRYMPQNPSFPLNMKVKEIFYLIQELKNEEGKYLNELIDMFGVDRFLDKYIRELSGGMKQKVNIIQAFMFSGMLYLLDEPTVGLDPNAAYLLKQLILEKKKQGFSVLFTSHIMSEVEQIADNVFLMMDGNVCFKESPASIISRAKSKNLEEALRFYWEDKS